MLGTGCGVAFGGGGVSLDTATAHRPAAAAIFAKKARTIQTSPDPVSEEPKLPPADWNGMLPQVRAVVRDAFPKDVESKSFSLGQEVD